MIKIDWISKFEDFGLLENIEEKEKLKELFTYIYEAFYSGVKSKEIISNFDRLIFYDFNLKFLQIAKLSSMLDNQLRNDRDITLIQLKKVITKLEETDEICA